MLAKPLLRTETGELEKCILCNRPIQPSEVKQGVGVQGLKTIEEKAKIWEKIDIPDDHEMIEFTKVHKPPSLYGFKSVFFTMLQTKHNSFVFFTTLSDCLFFSEDCSTDLSCRSVLG